MNKNIYKIENNLYITSDEEIKGICWCFDTKDNEVKLHQGGLTSYHYINYKKIIMTTDKRLEILCGCGNKNCTAEKSDIEFIEKKF